MTKALTILMFAAIVIIGWGMNIASLASMDFGGGITIEALLRIAGLLVVPLGAVLGYFV